MRVSEGQIYEGALTALGAEGPNMRWLVISPQGKIHAHSLGDPLQLHCMPIGILEQCLAQGTLSYVETQLDHPIIRLQRAKQEFGISDAHLGLHGKQLQKMLQLLEYSVENAFDYVPHLAGEILSLVVRESISGDELRDLHAKVSSLLPPH